MEHNLQLQRQFKDTLEHQVNLADELKQVQEDRFQVQMLSIKAAEQDSVAQVHKKRIQENLIRVQAMTEEIQALSTEITERNQTIYEKVIFPCSSFSFLIT